MSSSVKLSSKLAADDDLNGLDSLATDMIDNPKQQRVAIVWFDTVKVTVDTDTETEVPTARIRRFEPLGNVEDVDTTVRDLVAKATEARTGKSPLPFDAPYEVED